MVRLLAPSLATSASPLVRALAEWERVLGPTHVHATQAVRERYGRSTSSHQTRPGAVLLPGTEEEVQAVVRIAARHGIGLHPISRGKNWGYGDACAPRDGQVIVDLQRMNRILEVDEELCYVVLEPGVTQAQLADHLRQHAPGLWMDATGAGSEASIVGNVLERGFGHTPYGDRFQSVCGLSAVLADGRVLRTGYGEWAHARAQHVFRHGLGPSVDGLFSQSSLGIVTRMGLWLMPAPESFCAFFFSAPAPGDLADVVERLRPLRLQGVLNSAIHIGNDLRLISSHRRYPWDRTEGRTPLPADVRAELRREHGLGAWNVCGGLYGTKASVAAAKRSLQRALRGRYRAVFLTPARLRRLRRLGELLDSVGCGRGLLERARSVEPIMELLQGRPSDAFLQGVAWRVRGPVAEGPQDPLDVHAGLRWVSPVVPARGADAAEVVDLLTPIYESHGFEPLITFTLVSPRAMCCVTNIAYDRRQADEARRADACHHELMEALRRAGFLPYRGGPLMGAELRREGQVFQDVARRLKRALDPGEIISPGRL